MDKNPQKHRPGEAARIGVSQRRMIARQQMQAIGQDILGSMRKDILGFALDDTGVQQVRKIAVEGDLAEANNDANAREGSDLRREMAGTVANLLRKRLISGWGASNYRGDPGMAKLEAIISRDGAVFRSQTEIVEDGIHEVAGAIACKGSACTVGPVGPGGEAQNQDAGARIAKTRNGFGPVNLIAVGLAAGFPDIRTVIAEARTTITLDDGVANLLGDGKRR